jgi:hypothetical protein
MTAPVVKRGRVASKQLSGSGPTRCKWDNEGNLGIMDCQTILRIAIPSPRIQEPRSVFFQVLTFLHCGVCRRVARQLQLVDRPKLGGLMIDDAEDRYGGRRYPRGWERSCICLLFFVGHLLQCGFEMAANTSKLQRFFLRRSLFHV